MCKEKTYHFALCGHCIPRITPCRDVLLRIMKERGGGSGGGDFRRVMRDEGVMGKGKGGGGDGGGVSKKQLWRRCVRKRGWKVESGEACWRCRGGGEEEEKKEEEEVRMRKGCRFRGGEERDSAEGEHICGFYAGGWE